MKQKITKYLEDILYQLDGMTLQEAIEFLKSKAEKYKDYGDLKLKSYYEYEGDYVLGIL